MARSSKPASPRSSDRQFCGVIQEAAERANERHRKRTKPQPWIVRKLMIGVTLGILGYAAYVYIRQLCLPMIWQRAGAGGGRSTGIALLVVFCVLYLWVLWAYAMVCLTSPGYARDHIPKTERPLIPNEPFHDSWPSTDTDTRTTSQWQHDPEIGAGTGHRASSQSQQPRRSSISGTTSRTHGSPLFGPQLQSQQHKESGRGLAGPSYEDLLRRDVGLHSHSHSRSRSLSQGQAQDLNAGVLDALKPSRPAELRNESGPDVLKQQQYPTMSPIPPSSPSITSPNPHEQTRTLSSETAHESDAHAPSQNHTHTNPHSTPSPAHHPSFLNSKLNLKLKLKKPQPARAKLTSSTSSTTMRHEKALATERRLQALNVTRKPPSAPVLEPAHRYCEIDGLVKPFRAHHCRVCGTCVLKYDHHCPWIGQCVGARNHKYFLNFNQASAVLTAYVLGTMIAYTVKASTAVSGDVDPQRIVLIALAGLFLLFTLLLAISHTHLILNGQATVESMQVRSMKEREERVLARGFAWWEFGAKRRKQREWDEEWGRIGKEGYIWWQGSRYAQWVDVMGRNWVGWVLPIGRGGGDGLDYPVNPRFDSQGRWRRRAEWPEELR